MNEILVANILIEGVTMKIYNEDVMKAVRQSIGCSDGDDTSKDETIMAMPKEEVFERYCTWNGLLGRRYQWLIDAVESIYEIKLTK